LALVMKGLAQYQSPVTIVPGLLRLGARQLLADGITPSQIDDLAHRIDDGTLERDERLVVVRVATYLAAEAALPDSGRTDAEACFEPARRLLVAACGSVTQDSLFQNHVRGACSESIQMYLDMINEACAANPQVAAMLSRSRALMGQIRTSLEPRQHIRVFSIFDLLAARSFPRHQECHFVRAIDPGRVTIMVSHRWENVDCPDPDGMHFHGVVRFVIKACMMAMGSSPCVFNSVDFSDTILCHTLYFALQDTFHNHVDRWLKGNAAKEFPTDTALHRRLTLLHEYMKETIGDSNTNLVAPDLVALTEMMDHVDIWYDYTSLPQLPRSASEEQEFQNAVETIDSAFRENFTLIIWSRRSLNRLWLIFEALLSVRNWRHSLFSSDNSIRSSMKPAPISQLRYRIDGFEIQDEAGKRLPPSPALASINDALRGNHTILELWDSCTLAQFGRERQAVDLSHDLSAELRP
jgi:hypothetical protein